MQNDRRLFSVLTVLAAAFCVTGSIEAYEAPPGGATPAQSSAGAPFLSESVAAMNRMMADMGVKPSGNVDVDFTAMMIPHHQGAIDMAVAYLRHGQNEQLRRLAQEIIVEQQQEIAAMRLALGQPLPPSAPAPTQPGVAPLDPSAPIPSTHDHSAMHMLAQ
jgi:hypothetical protein